VKLLLDECIDWRLSRSIEGHETRTARQMGWTSIKNGELLALAHKEFDVFITVDRNLSFQQNLTDFSLAVIVLRSRSNRLADLRLLIPALLEQLSAVKPGAVTFVGGPASKP
jgi:predicted nuclease of predicted toxin-antitoxin system